MSRLTFAGRVYVMQHIRFNLSKICPYTWYVKRIGYRIPINLQTNILTKGQTTHFDPGHLLAKQYQLRRFLLFYVNWMVRTEIELPEQMKYLIIVLVLVRTSLATLKSSAWTISPCCKCK